MDELHSVLRSLRPAPKTGRNSGRDHLTVFREFLNHLDRIGKENATRDVKALRKRNGRKRPKG
ncbi:hypothetical protein [Pseudorhodoplanes sinuspersici]|uniref:Uncharacterized protein n=1 Tax=Pseudorhodoplanes sinuspersici TaxID=1235591 RepID=A0A1W6ZU65_9HYPH|nr:hypothetical protein [Pseudorhodoplanes sinuspersici]ARQ00937.1 hypothetical protein CAK95_18965 [Pseudorhodoplanes sinuspersici]RKE72571.1 hypothetical protein DFP91_0439 [Pseudorhodoplanes sinuspersici]